MINLTPNYWKKFKSDGLLFEELIEEILQSMYPGKKFYKTQRTHDKNRDYEYLAPLLEGSESKVWMECKYHTTSTLPFHDVSMTFLMAYIEGVSQILIFSYSKVTNTFFEYVADYKNKTKKEVTVYSDYELEQLIFRNRKNINFHKYFPEYVTDEKDYPETNLECRYVLESKQGELLSSLKNYTRIVELNEEVSSKIYFTNNGNKEKHINLEINTHEFNCFELAMAPKSNIIIPCHSSVVIPLTFRLRQFNSDLKYPTIKITDAQGACNVYSVSTKLEYRWLADVPIIGESYKNFLKKEKQMLFDSQNLFISTIVGSSGMGKSRVIKELLFEAKRHNYHICYVDSDKHTITANFLVEKMISTISNLPLFNFENKNTICYLSKTDNENAYAAHLLYDKQVNIQKEKEQIVKYLVELLKKKSCIIALDNIQKYDSLSLELINKIIDYMQNEEMNSKFIFSFNNDYVYTGTDCHKLRTRLKYNADYDRKFFNYTKLNGFSEKEAREYIYACLDFNETNTQLDNIDYSQTIDGIISNFGNNPFYLKNVLLYLEQKNILCRSDTTNYYIADIEHFKKAMEILPPTIESLIAMREDMFLNHALKSEILRHDYNKLMMFLSFLQYIPRVLYVKLINNMDLLNLLYIVGFLEEDESYSIRFAHSVYEKYFSEKYLPENLPDNDLKLFLIYCKQLCYKKEFFFQLFLANFYLDAITESLFMEALDNIINWNVNMELAPRYLPVISRIIDESVFDITIEKYIDLYWALSNIVIRREGIEASIKYYDIVFEKFKRHPVLFSQHLTKVIKLFKEGILNLVNLHQQNGGLKKAQELLKIYETNFISTKYYTPQDLATIYNCIIICEYHLNHLENALTLNQKVSEIVKNDTIEYINSIKTNGDIYYHHSMAYKYQSEISYWWNEAYERYIEFWGDDIQTEMTSSLKIGIYIKGCLADILNDDYESASKKIRFLSNCINHTGMLYYEINIKLVKIIYLIAFRDFLNKSNMDCHEEIISLLNQCTDQCVNYGNVYSYINCFYLRAISQLCYGQFEFAFDNYTKVFQMLANTLTQEYEYHAWKFFYIEMTLLMKKMDKHFPTALFSCIVSNQLYQELISIRNMSIKELRDYEKKYRSLAPLCDHSGKISFPRI